MPCQTLANVQTKHRFPNVPALPNSSDELVTVGYKNQERNQSTNRRSP